MSNQGGFWRKVASAFVEIEPGSGPAPTPSGGSAPSAADLAAAAADTEALLAQLDGGAKPAAKAAPAPLAPHVPGDTPVGSVEEVPEGLPFSEIYGEAGVAHVHHTAEQMLQILDGLQAMPSEARRMAVQAMDAADDRWTLDDVVQDARQKREVLSQHCDHLAGIASAAEAQTTAEKAAADELLGQAEATIHEQIAQLEAELAAFRQDAADRKATATAHLQAVRDAVARETARHQSEIFRLQRIQAFFEAQTATANTPNPGN